MKECCKDAFDNDTAIEVKKRTGFVVTLKKMFSLLLGKRVHGTKTTKLPR